MSPSLKSQGLRHLAVVPLAVDHHRRPDFRKTLAPTTRAANGVREANKRLSIIQQQNAAAYFSLHTWRRLTNLLLR